jgi:DHA2 family multidrug resistance protein
MQQQQQYDLVEYGYRRVIITITVIVCSLLELIDTSIVNVATTQLMGNLGATLSEVSWVIAAYGIANVIVVPMSGWLSIRLGRRNYFAGSVILFTVASVLCGNSHTIWELVFFRFVQGIGGGALLATSQTILTEIFPPEKRGFASAMFGLGVIIGPTVGPLIGGYIITDYDWPWIFYVNLPLGIVAAFLAFTYIRNNPNVTEAMRKVKTDYLGILLLIVGVGSLQLILEQGDREDWFESTYITVFTIIAIFGLLLFIWRQLTAEHPVVDLRVVTKGNVGIGIIFNFILGFGLYTSVFIYPIFVQRFLGFTALQTGLSLLPGALMSGFMMPIVGIMLSKGVKPKYLIPLGLAVFAFFTYQMAGLMTPQTGSSDFFWALVTRGIGLGLLFVPLTTQTLGGLQGRDISSAAGLSNMVRQLGGSFGVAICSTMIARITFQHRGHLIEYVSLYNNNAVDRINQTTQSLMARGSAASTATAQAYGMMESVVYKQATVLTYYDIFLYLGVFFMFMIPLVLLIRKVKNTGPVDTSSAH